MKLPIEKLIEHINDEIEDYNNILRDDYDTDIDKVLEICDMDCGEFEAGYIRALEEIRTYLKIKTNYNHDEAPH